MITSSPTRKRGAPRGNRNALKHGFYPRQFKKADLSDLDKANLSGLQDEITMLRLFIRRVLELGRDVEDLYEAQYLLRTVSLAVITLTRLIKTQHWLSSGDDEVSQALKQALLEVNQEMGLIEKPSP